MAEHDLGHVVNGVMVLTFFLTSDRLVLGGTCNISTITLTCFLLSFAYFLFVTDYVAYISNALMRIRVARYPRIKIFMVLPYIHNYIFFIVNDFDEEHDFISLFCNGNHWSEMVPNYSYRSLCSWNGRSAYMISAV